MYIFLFFCGFSETKSDNKKEKRRKGDKKKEEVETSDEELGESGGKSFEFHDFDL